jgi:hypothetical protein
LLLRFWQLGNRLLGRRFELADKAGASARYLGTNFVLSKSQKSKRYTTRGNITKAMVLQKNLWHWQPPVLRSRPKGQMIWVAQA